MRWCWIVVALAACHDKDAPPPAKSPPVTAAPTPTTRTGPAPVLPGEAPPDPRGMPPAEGFAAEQPDPGWKTSTEKMLRDKLGKLPDAHIECRRTLCEVAVKGDPMTTVDQLEHLRGVAQSVSLTRDADQVRAYLRFDRPGD
jgi:hypothetical protein